jgi:hypothetical protein
MQHHVWTALHVKPKIMESFPSTPPAVGIRIYRNDVQLLHLGVLHELAMHVGVLEIHSVSSLDLVPPVALQSV